MTRIFVRLLREHLSVDLKSVVSSAQKEALVTQLLQNALIVADNLLKVRENVIFYIFLAATKVFTPSPLLSPI